MVGESAKTPRSGNDRHREWFAAWWKLYWRKVARKDAEKAFRLHVKTDARFAQVIAATKAQLPMMMAREPDKQPYGAKWLNAERWDDEVEAPARKPPPGVRSRALQGSVGQETRKWRETGMNPETVLEILGELRVLRFFPNDEAVMNALVRLCGSMCASEKQVRWLVDRMTSGIYSEWPGIAEMRGCFCGRFKPADGINGYSSVYPDGLPPDPTAPPRPGIAAAALKALPAGALKALPQGHEESADPEVEAVIQWLADKCSMPPAYPAIDRFARMLREIETPPDRREFESRPVNPNFKPITQADIDRAVQELHERRARETKEAEQIETSPNLLMEGPCEDLQRKPSN